MPITPFQQALADYGHSNCLVNDTTLWIGQDGTRDWPNARRLEPAPAIPLRIEFCAAPIQSDLIAAFLRSPEALRVETLCISTSRWYQDRFSAADFPGYDMAAAVAALRGAHLPSLRMLLLGDMEDHAYRPFGTLGDVGHVPAAAPALYHLGLYGNFELSAPLSHARLGELTALFDTCGITGDPISQSTFANLLASRLPALMLLHLELSDGGDDDTLEIPDTFFVPRFPALRKLYLDRLTPESRSRLEAYMATHAIEMSE